MTARTYEIDGRQMTFAQICMACPGVKPETIQARLCRHGWRKLSDLRAPPLPGRKSPWRAWSPGQFRKSDGRSYER